MTVDFQLQGEDPSYFTSSVLACEDPPNSDYAISYTGDPTTEFVTVTFTNQVEIVSSTSFCFDIKLSLDGFGELASKRATYNINLDESGIATVSTEFGPTDLLISGAGSSTYMYDITSGRNPDIQITQAVPGPHYLGAELELIVQGTSNYFYRVDSVFPLDITLRGGNASLGETNLFIKVPPPYFVAGYLLLDLNVAWSVNGFDGSRQLISQDSGDDSVQPRGSQAFKVPILLANDYNVRSNENRNQRKNQEGVAFALAAACVVLVSSLGFVVHHFVRQRKLSQHRCYEVEDNDTSTGDLTNQLDTVGSHGSDLTFFSLVNGLREEVIV